ncbi:26S proteasome non-ATPase regulatory subunit 13 isoform X1 [Ursus americanus]|uniref:26S proteasome non-ATPase regulatory subunit 13 n=1 Tax=Ursus maritimus TaxID=29073 RepID=A0A8M1GJ62_URSMA|nr:26S proteasome non-ATPase regulatory subunit 13 isoform X1 [Ursus arctos]XP_040495723.1 26S proteasome non-ATPase regulatory subunit 13 isoform X1 [Ursus maritimus]XP_040495724.1 26S proteasome non-ATPase regulatory subunit 13 isoform X2 [Ursus maritimus]XP_045626797.1 26S proteasome non-ATPase regulatory subunit 13 isoform X1 [Ursus americanus]
MKDVPGFLQQSQSSGPGQAAVWHRLEELYTKKLWHQLTLQVLDFVQDPCFAQGDGLIKLYENFISEFEHRVNPLSLVEIILHVVRQMTDPTVALTFLEKTREKVKSSDEAVILCKTAIGALKLNIGDLQVTKETIEDVEEMLSSLPGVTSVHSRFYDLSSKYYQTVGNHAAYYKDALRFLGCVDIKDLPVSEQQERAFTLGLAGLLGEGVFNFGELLMHPVLESLRSTDRQWLIDTLYAFNSGNVERFQTLKTAWGQQPDLAANEPQLLRKIQLLCLMEMTFTRPANHRQLTFEEIAKSAKITVNEGLGVTHSSPSAQVELLVMKALSVGLVKGSIDEVDKRVHMTWVQPRVLDLQQIKGMKDRLEFWCADVRSMEMLVEHQAHDILT